MQKIIILLLIFIFSTPVFSQQTVDIYKDQKANQKNFPSNLKKGDQLIWCIDSEKKKGKWVVVLKITKKEIEILQEKLLALGFITTKEKIQKGVFDENTVQAVIAFEKTNGKIYDCCGLIGISKGMKKRIEKAFRKKKRLQKKN
jgi:hypothetical protein